MTEFRHLTVVISNDKEEQATAKVVDKVVHEKLVQLHSLLFLCWKRGTGYLALHLIWRCKTARKAEKNF